MQPRSTFVEVIAWVFIVLSGFGVLLGILQNIMIFTVFPDDFAAQLPADRRDDTGAWLFEYFRFFFLFFLAATIAVLLAAIGLLRRRNWARLTFVGLMVFGIVWNVAGLVMQWWVLSELMPPAARHPEITQQFESMWTVMRWASVVMALAFSGLFAWIAWQLTRPAIRAEFQP